MPAALAGAAMLVIVTSAGAVVAPATARASSERSVEDPLMVAARTELDASNRHDLSGFLQKFTEDAVILVDAPPYSYHGRKAFADFFRHNSLGTQVRYTIKPGAPQTEDRVGDHAYLEFAVNVRAADAKGDAFNDPIHWIAALARTDGRWEIDVLTLTTTGG